MVSEPEQPFDRKAYALRVLRWPDDTLRQVYRFTLECSPWSAEWIDTRKQCLEVMEEEEKHRQAQWEEKQTQAVAKRLALIFQNYPSF